MKRVTAALIVTLLLAGPSIARAQQHQWGGSFTSGDQRNPYEYRDVDDSQLLRLAAYALTPAGMLLEWGIMRPLHHVATQTPLAPVLSGDKDVYYFGQNNNSDLVPAGTFAPAPMNLSTSFEPSGPERSPATSHVDELLIPPSREGQSTIH
jgi:hypothetical protein